MKSSMRHGSRSLLMTIATATIISCTLQAPGYIWAAPVSLTTGATYSENFTHSALDKNGTNSSTPAGWSFSETGTNANTTYTADTGSTATGNTYSYGANNDNDRAFGTLRDANLVSTIGSNFTNNTGRIIAGLLITYNGEQWRLGATGRTDRLDFQYNTNASTITAVTGTWTDFNSLDFTAPVTTGSTGAKDGNNATNRTALSQTISSLSIANGATFGLRWQDFDATGNDDGLGVDDFTLTPQFNNNSQITAPASAAFGRIMLNATPSQVVGLTKTGADTTTYTAVSSSSGLGVTADGSILAGSVTENITLAMVNNANGSGATGVKAYTVTIDNTAATSESAGLGSADANDTINVSATVLSQRTVTPSTTSVNFGSNLLRGAKASTNVNLSTTGDDNNRTRVNVAATTATDANGVGFSAGSGTLFDDAADTGSRTLSATFATYGNLSGSHGLAVTTAELAGVGDTAAYAPVNVSYSATNVGNATADKSNSMGTFGAALSASVALTGSYANLDSRVFSTSGTGGGPALNSVATIRDGTNSSGTDTGVSMAWRTRTQGETSLAEGGSPAYPPLSTMSHLISDVVNVSGMVNDAGTNPNLTDIYVLQMTYDESLLLAPESLLAPLGKIYLAWLNPAEGGPTGKWRNAVMGNIGGPSTIGSPVLAGYSTYFAGTAGSNGTKSSNSFGLGDWGVDTANNLVWAVINHNSSFAAVPEPSTICLGLGGLASLLIVAIRRKRAA